MEFHSSTAEAEAGDGVSGVPYGRLEMLIFVFVITSSFSKVKPQRSYTGIRHGLYLCFFLFFLQAIVEFHSSTAEAEVGDGVSGVPCGWLEMLFFFVRHIFLISNFKPQRAYTGM